MAQDFYKGEKKKKKKDQEGMKKMTDSSFVLPKIEIIGKGKKKNEW